MHPFVRFLFSVYLPVVFLTGMGVAQDLERIAPKRPPVSRGSIQTPVNEPATLTGGTDAVLVKKLCGIVFMASQKEVKTTGLAGMDGIHCEGVYPPGGESFDQVAAVYLGKPVSLASLNQLTRDVVLYYREHDRPVVDVILPEQDITQGFLQLIVIESRIGTVKAQGNHWFHSDRLESLMQLKPGDSISGTRVAAGLDWLNNNPFRRVNLLYTPGKEPGTTDLILDTKDRFPLRVYTGYENSGTPSIGSNQYFAGFNWGDAFFLDHQLNYQFTASGDFQSSLSQSVTYDAPLPWRHTFSIIGAYSKTASQDGSPVNSAGYSYQLSPRYKIPLKPVGGMVHSLIAGFDFKRTNNNLEFGGYNVFNTNIDIIQWLAGYEASGHDSLGTTTLNSIFVYSPGGLDGYNSDAAYQQARAGSRSNYVYARGMLERLNRLPADFSLMTRATVQWTDANLQASEQLGAGGWSTVRGYEEGAARGDSGLLFSMELRSPSFSPIHWFDRKSKPEKPGVVAAASLDKIVIVDQLQFLCFWDYGIAQTRYPQPGEIRQENLSGVGAGVRYTVNTWLSLRFDYGWQMINPGVNDPYSSRAYLGAVISY